ncbi:MAG: hypothetical protein ACFE9I_01320 [Candidatus Hermodarchaeota archaeon]
MELNSIHLDSLDPHTNRGVQCGICRNHIGREAKIYKEGLTFGVVCEKCYRDNSPQDLEFMANLFHAYGGYFGMIKDSEFSLYHLLKPLASTTNSNDKMNIKKIHQALLHGVTPHQYKQGLKILLED